jgi:hypothetical protein
MKSLLSFVCTILFYYSALAQKETHYFSGSNQLQYGFSLKALLEFHIASRDEPVPVIHLSANAGIARSVFVSNFYPSVNIEVQFYNGGIGSAYTGRKQNHWTLDQVTAFTLTGGYNNHLAKTDDVYKNINPLYYFSDFVFPSLINPFDVSLSFGTNFILSTSRMHQRIGFFNLNLKRAQVTYYNDGGPILSWPVFGDGEDRFYTGGLVLSYHGKTQDGINLGELSYHKFTGYAKDAFQVSNILHLYSVNYADNKQQNFNKSVWSVNLANPNKGYGLKFQAFNSAKWDFQHFIHFNSFWAYHTVEHPKHFSIAPQYYFIKNYISQ